MGVDPARTQQGQPDIFVHCGVTNTYGFYTSRAEAEKAYKRLNEIGCDLFALFKDTLHSLDVWPYEREKMTIRYNLGKTVGQVFYEGERIGMAYIDFGDLCITLII